MRQPPYLRALDLSERLDRLRSELGGDCSAWAGSLHGDAELCLRRGDTDAAAAYRLLARACEPLLAPEDPRGPYLARVDPSGERATHPADLSPGELDFLDLSASSAAPWCWQARVADFLWIARADPRAGRRACACFVHGARSFSERDPRSVWTASSCLLRAGELACGLPAESGARAELSRELAALLPRAREWPQPLLLDTLLKVACKLRQEHVRELIEAAMARGESEILRGSFHWGRVFFAHAHRFLAREGDAREAETLAILGSTLLADEARFRRKANEPAWISAALLSRAIHRLRELGDTCVLVDGLQREVQALHCEDGSRGQAASAAQLLEDVDEAFDHTPPDERPLMLAALPLERFAGSRAALPIRLGWDRARREWTVYEEAVPPALPASADSAVLRLWAEGPLEELRRRWVLDPLCRGALEALARDHPLARGVEGRALVLGVEACLMGDVRQGLALLMPSLRVAAGSPALDPKLQSVLAAMCHPTDATGARLETPTSFRVLRAEANLALWGALRLLTQRVASAVLQAPRMLPPQSASA